MNGFEYALENDEFESDEFESDEALESDESDEFDERRRRLRRPPRINPGRTGRGTGLFKPRPATNKYVTQAQLEAGLARVGKQIAQNSDAIKKVAAQATKINSQLGATTSRIDKELKETRKEVKRQGETALLLTLLQKAPELEARPGQETTAAPVLSSVQVKRQNNLLPLLLMSGSGGLGGGDNNQMLFLALAMSGQL